MDDKSQFKTALALAHRALEFVAAYRTPPTPRAYELFYAVAAGTNADLNEAVAAVIAEKQAVSTADVDTLYQKHVARDASPEGLQDVAERLNSELASNLRILGSAAESTQSYGQSLDDAERQLESAADAPTTKSVIQALVDATKEMSRVNSELTANLNCSRSQVENLEECLKVAREEASKDGLTGLTSRARFDLLLNETILFAAQDGQPISLLMLDIDHFKDFNDKFGHPAGDATLRYVSSCIKSNVKGRDVAARYGGEEFAVILNNTALPDAVTIANQIRETVNDKELTRRSTGEVMGRVSVSIGVAQAHKDDSAESLLNRADMCLLAAKRGGRNKVMSEAETPVVAEPGGAPMAAAG